MSVIISRMGFYAVSAAVCVTLASCGSTAQTHVSPPASATVPTATVTSAGAASPHGSATSPGSSGNFSAQLNSLCEQSRAAILAAIHTASGVLDGPRVAVIIGPYVQRIARLTPPPGLAGMFQRYTVLVQQGMTDSRGGNLTAAAQLAPERDALANKLGAPACVKAN